MRSQSVTRDQLAASLITTEAPREEGSVWDPGYRIRVEVTLTLTLTLTLTITITITITITLGPAGALAGGLAYVH